MRKKIVFVIESLHLGGAEKSLVTLLQNLDFSKYDVDLITFHHDGFFKDFVPKEVNRINIDFPKIGILDRLRYAFKRKFFTKFHSAQLFWDITKKKKHRVEQDYHVAIAYNQGMATYFVNQCVKAGKKYAWLNTDYQKAGYNIGFDFPIYTNYNKIIAVSSEAKEALERELHKRNYSLKIEVVKDITDKKILLQQAGMPMKVSFNADKVNLVTVARLVRAKGLKIAIDACKILIASGIAVNWYVIGEGNERSALEKQLKMEGLEDIFFLLGADSNPYPYIKNCDIYVQTSLFEGLGLTVIEASFLNKAIVTTNFPTAFGILKHNVTGIITEMDASSVAMGILGLIENKELKNLIVDNLKKQTDDGKDATLKQIHDLFEK